MAIITVNADLRATAKALGRIADVLERIATQYMGITLADGEEPEAKSAAEEVAYTSDRQEVRKEISAKLNIPLGDEDEPEG